MTTITIIIQNAPYRPDNKAWHALRFAGAALAEDMEVQVHLLDDGVELGRQGHVVPESAVNLEELLTELMECGLKVRACGMSLADCQIHDPVLGPDNCRHCGDREMADGQYVRPTETRG
jgi:sulfur relay (sulfurtransferase) complex TusBCD TusD component (DsrE family)